MSMMLELSSRMIDYLPEEVSKIQRTIELATSETLTEEEMFAKVDSVLITKHLREGAREFWDVWSNASDYAEPLTEGVGGFPVDKSVLQKNRSKDRNIGRVIDVSGNQVLIINKRSSGDYVVVDKMGKRSVKKADGLGTTRTETVELNVLDQIDEEDMSASESPNGAKKKAGKTTVIINPKPSDLMKEGKASKDYDGDGKVESGAKEHAGAVHNAIQRKKGGKADGQDTANIKEKIDVGADAGKTISDFVRSKDPRFEGDSKKQRIKRALGAYYGAQKEEVEIQEDKDPCWKGYKQIGMKDKGGRQVPNCVPKEEYEDLVGQLVSEGYEDEQVREILEAIEEGMEVVFEENGYSIISEETLDEDAQFFEEVEMVADWLHTEGVIENEDQFFDLMEDLSEEEIQELYDVVMEATAMAKRGYDETKLRQRAGGGEAADRATSLENRPTYGDANKAKQRQNYARAQRGDFRKTASSNPGLHGYAHKSDDPKVKAKQAARGAQRGALTPNEKKNLNMGMEMIGNSLEEGGMEVRTYSWREVMGEAWKGSKKGGNK
jgi:hypothetical protein